MNFYCSRTEKNPNLGLTHTQNPKKTWNVYTDDGWTFHLNTLKKGFKAYMLFVVQREDCNSFSIAKDIDPKYFEILTLAIKKNVKILCYDCKFTSKGIKLNKEIKLKINE